MLKKTKFKSNKIFSKAINFTKCKNNYNTIFLLIRKNLDILVTKKDLISQANRHGTPSGVRTLDTPIKSIVKQFFLPEYH